MFEQNYVDVPSTSICSLEMENDEIQPSRSFVLFHKHFACYIILCFLGWLLLPYTKTWAPLLFHGFRSNIKCSLKPC